MLRDQAFGRIAFPAGHDDNSGRFGNRDIHDPLHADDMEIGVAAKCTVIAEPRRDTVYRVQTGVVGATLFLTVVGTLFFMALGSIEIERIPFASLIIAMEMLVDNAIVVAEGMQINMQRGKTSREASTEAASKTQIPLLGAK